MEILDGLLNEVGYDKDELTAISKFEQDFYKKLNDLEARNLVLRVDDEYQVGVDGKELIDSFEQKATTIESEAESDYAFLKRIEILNLTTGVYVEKNDIVDSMMREINLDLISVREKYESSVQQKLLDLDARDLIVSVGRSVGDKLYRISNAGQALIDNFESKNKQVEELTPSDEDLKLEILLRMADYYDGGVYKLLNQDDIIKYAVKHTFSIPSNKYFGLVVKLLGDGFVEKDPSGDTDSIRLTNQGYDKAMNWFEENLPEEATSIEEPTQGLNYRRPSPLESATINPTGTTKIGNDGNEWRVTENKNGVKRWVKVGEPQYDLPQHRLEGVLKRLSEAISKINDYVTISEFYTQLYDVIVPINYTQYGLSGEPSLEKDLEVMERMGLVKSRKTTFGKEYYIDTKGGEMLTQLKFEEAQKQKPQILAQAQITKTPEFSQEPPISEIEEDEVDLDILEQQLNDDSLEFDISDEDLDNLEF
jgi:hypothetical protein